MTSDKKKGVQDVLSQEAKDRQAKGLSIEGMNITEDPDAGISQALLDLQREGIMQVLRQRAKDRKAGVDHDLE